MTIPVPHFDDAIVQVVARLQADSALAAAGWVVYDGEAAPGDDDDRIVYIGWDGDSNGDRAQFTDLRLTYRGLGANRQDEAFGIICSLFALGRGDAEDAPGMAELRAVVRVGFGAVVNALRSKTNIGLGLPGPSISGVTQAAGYAELPLRRYRMAFTVAVSTRI